MTDQQVLRRDVETLNQLLEQALIEQAGPDLFQLLTQLKQLARERRVGLPGSAERLAARIHDLSEAELNYAVRALSIYFDLANLAEDLQRVRVLRQREQTAVTAARPESIATAIAKLKEKGITPQEMQGLIDRLGIGLVFTAHPTEAKRRTTRRVLRQLRTCLQDLQRTPLLPRERTALIDEILACLTLLWRVDPLRPQPPTVMQEVERGLFFMDGLWEIIPQLVGEMRQALAVHFPEQEFHVGQFLKFGSWIGGDRDGNPFVTHELTANTLLLLQRAAIDRHLKACRKLQQMLVMSSDRLTSDDVVAVALNKLFAQSSGMSKVVADISPVEVYRRWLRIIEVKLMRTLSAADGTASDAEGYHHPSELERDVELIAKGLEQQHAERVGAIYVKGWLDQIRTFGLQAASLDVRQDSRTHLEVIGEVFKKLGIHADYATTDEATRITLLTKPNSAGNELTQQGVSDTARESLSLFKLIARVVRHSGPERFGGYVISMTHHPSDILTVLWLWKWGWRATPNNADKPLPFVPIAPLLETIDDLRRGPEILEALFSIPEYMDYLKSGTSSSGGTEMPTQHVMVGYSDSTKDGGYLAASWGLYRCQEKLADVAAKHGVRLTLFHGRGGALGRGGGPAARAILSLPPQSVGGALRMTEQGEVLAERYDDPQIAFRHLEQVTWATLLVSGLPAPTINPEWSAMMDRFAERSYLHYRQFVDHPGFLRYFDRATPISEIERLPIGSRPSRRRERRSLSDLRAIPWTFAWTQSRHLLPAWYGLGFALTEATSQAEVTWPQLQQMYLEWPWFHAAVDNAGLALSKADLAISQRYAELCDADSDEEQRATKEVWELIATEFERSRAAVLMITGEPALLARTPWLQQSIQERNPYVDPLNLIQIELLTRLRTEAAQGNEAAAMRLQQAVRLTIQGIASGLRTTG